MQMNKLARLRHRSGTTIETMVESGRRFKRTFQSTPTQAQVMLKDPFDNQHPSQRTVWYQSNYYRANLHFLGDEFYIRDLHVYDDRFPEPYLSEVVRKHGIEQRMLAVLDGYHWSDDNVRVGRPGLRALGRFVLIGKDQSVTPLLMQGQPSVTEVETTLRTHVPLHGGGELVSVFRERDLSFSLTGRNAGRKLGLVFEWVKDRSAFQTISAGRLRYRFLNFEYSIGVSDGKPSETPNGLQVVSDGRRLLFSMVQRISQSGQEI